MTEERYLGLNMSVIPKDAIPFTEHLENRESIENEKGDILIWIPNYKGYLLLTNDPTDYLHISRVYSHWKKREI